MIADIHNFMCYRLEVYEISIGGGIIWVGIFVVVVVSLRVQCRIRWCGGWMVVAMIYY